MRYFLCIASFFLLASSVTAAPLTGPSFMNISTGGQPALRSTQIGNTLKVTGTDGIAIGMDRSSKTMTVSAPGKQNVLSNATTLGKISESGGNPLWNGGTWPGGGGGGGAGSFGAITGKPIDNAALLSILNSYPESYRAIGDGASHTLTSLGINYAQSQSYWPLSFAAGLFNSGNYGGKENDWLAFNEAILACDSSHMVVLSRFYYVGSNPTTITNPITVAGVSRWDSGLVAAASPYFKVLTVAQYRGSGSSPNYAGGFEGGAHARLTNFHIKRAAKDWPNSQDSVGLQIGDGGDGYSYGASVDHMVIENFGINLRLTDMGHGHIGQNNLYDFGVAGLMTAADGGSYGLGDNDIVGNYAMGDSQLHIRNYSTYEGTALETAFGGASHRPLSTKTAASYDIALKNQVAAYWHKFGGGNKFVANKAHVTTNGYRVDFIDGIYFTGNASEFILFEAITMPLNASSGGYSEQGRITITGNELSYGRTFTDYSYFGKTPTGIHLDATNAGSGISTTTITGNVFPSTGYSQNSAQGIRGIYIDGNSSSQFGAVEIGNNTGAGLSVGVEVNAAILPANCDILYGLMNHDDTVYPATVGGYVDTIDTNGCLTDSVVSAAGSSGEVQLAGASGNLDSSPEFTYSNNVLTVTRDTDDGLATQFIMRKSKNGGAVAAEANIFTNIAEGHDGTTYQVDARYDMRTSENHDGTHRGTKHIWRAVNSGGSTTLHEQMRLVNDKLGIGLPLSGTMFAADPAYTLDIAGGTSGGVANVNSIRFAGDGTTLTTAPVAVTAAGSTGEVQVRNSDGTLTAYPSLSTDGDTTLFKKNFSDNKPRWEVYNDSGVVKAYADYNGNIHANSFQLNSGGVIGDGTVTSITPGVGFTSSTPITTTGTLDINVGTGANQIPQYDSSARLTLNAPTTALNVLATGAANVVPFRSERYRSAGTAVTAPLACMEVSLNSNAADIQDGGGPLVNFVFTDSGATSQLLGQIGAVRAGADNTGDIVLQPTTAGTGTIKLRVTHDGKTVVNEGTNIVYYCDGGTNAGLLGRGNAGPCSGGTWVATSLKLD